MAGSEAIFRGKIFLLLSIFLLFSAFSPRKMPKRTNPFGDASPLQFKSHIGTKEIDTGVAKDQNMQSVYGKKISKFNLGLCKLKSSKGRGYMLT